MQIRDIDEPALRTIRDFESRGAASAELATGEGESHLHLLRFEPGGRIGRHEAGFDQALVVLHGRGWAEGDDGVRRPISRGSVVFVEKGEVHAKGSESGMVALMIQVDELRPMPHEDEVSP